MKRFIEAISSHLDVEPADALDRIKALPKPQDLLDLQARVDFLLKENGELKAKVEEGDALWKEVGDLKNRIKAMEREVKTARAERDKSKEVVHKVHGFLGYPGYVLNKARLYDHGLKQPTTDSGIKMMRCMVDYSLKLEKTLKEFHSLFHPIGAQPELVGTPCAGPSTTPARTSSPEFVTPPATQPNPLLQEPIPVLNTEEMASLRNWAKAGPGVLMTPTTGTGNNPVDPSSPGSASQEHQRRQEEHTKRKADESVSESDSSEEEEEESLVSLDSNDEEYQGSDTPSDPGKPEPHFRSIGPLPGRCRRRSPLAPSARQSGSRIRVVVIELKRGEEVSSSQVESRKVVFW